MFTMKCPDCKKRTLKHYASHKLRSIKLHAYKCLACGYSTCWHDSIGKAKQQTKTDGEDGA